MAIMETSIADLTVALTNGTDESAVNANGNYEIVVSVGTDYGVSGLRTSVSFIRTDDSDYKDRRQRSVWPHGVCGRSYGGDARLQGGNRRPPVG